MNDPRLDELIRAAGRLGDPPPELLDRIEQQLPARQRRARLAIGGGLVGLAAVIGWLVIAPGLRVPTPAPVEPENTVVIAPPAQPAPVVHVALANNHIAAPLKSRNPNVTIVRVYSQVVSNVEPAGSDPLEPHDRRLPHEEATQTLPG